MNTDTTGETKMNQYLARIEMQLDRQNSLRRMFVAGVVYGVGFFVGSAIIATLAFGILGPYLGQIPWVHDAFTSGNSLRGR